MPFFSPDPRVLRMLRVPRARGIALGLLSPLALGAVLHACDFGIPLDGLTGGDGAASDGPQADGPLPMGDAEAGLPAVPPCR